MKFIRTVAAAAAVIFSTTFATPAFARHSMMGSNMAMPSCAAGDNVVWANSRTKVYHMPGTPRYGKTKHGKFLCMSQATSMGFHAAKRESMSGSNGSMGRSGSMGAPGAMASPGMMDDSTHHMGKHHKKHRSMMNGDAPSTHLTPVPNPTSSSN